MTDIFKILAAAVSIYSLLCTVRIILTWIPGAAYSGAGRFLSNLCDPFLNMFSRIRWLRFGALDFSPILALAVLTMLSYLFQNIAAGGRISLGGILALVIQLAWSVMSSLLMFLALIVVIRLIVFFSGADRNSPLWAQVDSSLNPLIYSMSKFLTGGKPVSFKNALILALIVVLIMRFGGSIVVGGLITMCRQIPL